MKLPKAKVAAAVKAYNDAVKAGTLAQMNPPCTYKPEKAHPIAKAAFYAIPFQGGMTATFGGPLINVKAEVQNLERRSIPGSTPWAMPLAAFSSTTMRAVRSLVRRRFSGESQAKSLPSAPRLRSDHPWRKTK